MVDNVTHLRVVGAGAKSDDPPTLPSLKSDEMLVDCVGKFSEAIVVGVDDKGNMVVQTTHGLRSAVWLTECGKQILLEQSFDGA